MGKDRLGPSKGFRVFLGLFLLPLLASAFGCVSDTSYVREEPQVPDLREYIVDYATTLLGKPYRNGAKGPDTFDCSGYVSYVYSQFGVAIPVSTDGLSKAGREVSRGDILMGDLAIFDIKGDLHVGIVINRLEFIHASKSRGVTIDSIDAPYWKKTFSQFRRIL